MSRKPHSPTDEQRKTVETMAGYGMPHEDIALFLDVSGNTLTKYYGRELKMGRVKANSKVTQGLFQQAMAGNTTASIFWLKTRAGWRETVHVKSESTVDLNANVATTDLPRLSREEWLIKHGLPCD